MQEITDIHELGTLIRQKRKAQGLTQEDFADIAGVGTRVVSEIERGKQTAEVGKVLLLAKLAGVKLYTEDV